MNATRATVLFISGNPFLVVSNMEGSNTYMRVTVALSPAEMRDLAGRLSAAAAVAEVPVEVTRPMCRGCLKDTADCVCAIRARAKRDAESKLCVACNSFGRICCRLHREPVRS